MSGHSNKEGVGWAGGCGRDVETSWWTLRLVYKTFQNGDKSLDQGKSLSVGKGSEARQQRGVIQKKGHTSGTFCGAGGTTLLCMQLFMLRGCWSAETKRDILSFSGVLSTKGSQRSSWAEIKPISPGGTNRPPRKERSNEGVCFCLLYTAEESYDAH